MSARPKRYWDTRQYAKKWDRNERRWSAGRSDGPWTVCVCHGRVLLWDTWAGLTKRRRSPSG